MTVKVIGDLTLNRKGSLFLDPLPSVILIVFYTQIVVIFTRLSYNVNNIHKVL